VYSKALNPHQLNPQRLLLHLLPLLLLKLT
jgi:hypothetical protein